MRDMHCVSKGCGIYQPFATIRHEIQAGPHKDEQPVASQPCNLQQELRMSAQPPCSTYHQTPPNVKRVHSISCCWHQGRGYLSIHKNSQLCSEHCRVCGQPISCACKSLVCSLLLWRMKHCTRQAPIHTWSDCGSASVAPRGEDWGLYLFAHAHQVHGWGKQDPLHHQQDPDLGPPPALQGLRLREAGEADDAPLCMGQDHPSDLL